MEDKYRFKNLTSDQVDQAKGLFQSYGLSPLPINRGAEAFDALPVDKRKLLFDTLQNAPKTSPVAEPEQPSSGRGAISEITIGGRVFRFDDQAPTEEPLVAEKPSITDILAQRGIQSRDADFSDTVFKPPSQVVTIEKLLERGYQARDAVPDAPYGEAMQKGFTRGVLEGGVTGLGIGGGIRAGVALTPFVASVAPMAAPFTPAVTGLAGFAASLFAQEEAADALELEEARPKDPRVQPLYEGMRTFGGFLGGGSIAYSLPTATASAGKIGKVIGEIGDFARANKKMYMAREAVMSAYAGLYGGTAVATFPPEEFPVAGPLVRLGVETLGGSFLSPGRLAFDAVMVGRSGMSVANEKKAAEAIRRVLEGEGEDIKKVADELAAAIADRPIDPATGLPVPLTSAQLINSRGLTMLERTLARNNAAFSAETKETGEQGLLFYNELLRRLKDSGDPNLVAKAVRMEEAHLQGNMQMAIDQATFIAADKAAKLGLRSVKDRAQIAKLIEAELQKVVDASRETQLELYTNSIANAFRVTGKGKVVPLKTTGTNLTQQYLELMTSYDRPTRSTLEADYGFVTGELGQLGLKTKEARKAYAAGTKTSDYMDFFKNKRQGTSPALTGVNIPEMRADRLIQLISDLRERARDFRGQGRTKLAKDYTMLANAALEDLNKLDDPVYAEARAFTKSFHDVFTRTFAGQLDDVDDTGRLRIPVETMVSRTVRGGADAAYMRMMEIRDAARFSEKLLALENRFAAGSNPEKIVTTVLGAQQRMLRSLAAETTEIRDGQRLINPKKFQAFTERNSDLIQEFGLQQEFSDILRAQQALDDVLAPASKVNYTLRGQKILADLLDNEDPFDPLFNAISGNTPVRDIKSVLQTINKSSLTVAEKALAKEGMKSILMDYAYRKAGGSENFIPSKYQTALFGPLNESDQRVFPSLMSLMRQEGLITPAEFKNHQKLLDVQLNIERTMSPGGKLVSEELLPSSAMSTLEELFMTQTMARIAGAASPGGPGSLSFAARLMRRGEKVFKQMPTQKQMAMLREAAKDPELMEQLLRKDLTMQEKRNLGQKLLSLIFSPGVTSTSFQRYINTPTPEERAEEEKEERIRRQQTRSALKDFQALPYYGPPSMDRLPRSQPPAPPVRGMPGMSGGQPPAGGGGGAPPTSQSRMMLQQLFPNDPITGAAAMQGGAPPMPG